MHCDFAFWVGGTHDNVADLPELERLPGAAGIKVFMGSSTGKLLVADDEGVLAILKAIRRRAAFHSEDEARLNERKHHCACRAITRRIPSGATKSPRSDRPSASSAWPARRMRRCMCCISRRGQEMALLAGRQGRRELRGDAASPDAERRGLSAARERGCR